jgi:hypothetical protein
MKQIALEKTDLTVQQLVRLAEAEPLVLTRAGVPIVGMIRMKETDREIWALGSNPEFLSFIEQARARGRREGGVSLAEARRQLTKQPRPTHPGSRGARGRTPSS